MIKMTEKTYLDKVLACWIGKNVGGTLGAPYEWQRQINNVTFYESDPGGNPLPNDDLDIQLLWLILMEDRGIFINSHIMSVYWSRFVTPYWCEYGTAKANLNARLLPPLSGTFNNPFKDSCGSYIRAEIWACIAPGNPKLATKYALEDSMIDHGFGEGTYAEIFIAAVESSAFIEKDIYKLIDIGLSHIPKDCAVAKAIKLVVDGYKSKKPYLDVRDEILEQYRGQNYCGRTSERDMAKGFENGPHGFDAPSNIAIIIIGLLYGAGDFDKTLCYAVNCGEDTDCTAATLGSIFGIIGGTKAIPEKWSKAIGSGIATMTLNIGELGAFNSRVPATVENLTERVYNIFKKVNERFNKDFIICGEDNIDLTEEDLYENYEKAWIYNFKDMVKHSFDDYDVFVDTGNEPTLEAETPKKVKLHIFTKKNMPEMIDYKIWTDDKLEVITPYEGSFYQGVFRTGQRVTALEIEVLSYTGCPATFLVTLSPKGIAPQMTVPVVLLNKI